MWTADALASEARPWRGAAWRVAEAQSHVSTMKLVDSLAEQQLLEEILERSKPAIPPICIGLDPLLYTPFRYDAAYPHGSRFRRAGSTEGCFYGADAPETAIAETAFYRLLFFLESPATKLPTNPLEMTAFSVQVGARHMVNLAAPPLNRDAALWTHPTDYEPCQRFAETARQAGVEVIRYLSVRDPQGGMNLALLDPAAFAARAPSSFQTWQLFIKPRAVQAFCEMPRGTIEFLLENWAADPRVADLLERGA
jgi:RES domain